MKTKCKRAAIGSGKSGLVAAIAVLAIAFVLMAAVPVAVTESDAATATLYVDGTKGDDNSDGTEAKPLKTITAALGKAVDEIVLLSDAADTGTITVSKAVTIKSDDKANGKYKISARIVANDSLTLKNVEIAPAKFTGADDAISITKGVLNIDGCKISITGTDNYRANGIISESQNVTSVTVKGTTFVNAGDTNYTRGMYIFGAQTLTLTDNTATGLHVFAAAASISQKITVTGNTSTGMTGDFMKPDETETRDSKFFQIGGTNAAVIEVTGNEVSAKDVNTADPLPVLNVHDSTVTASGKLTVEGFMRVTGVFTVGDAEVDGDILVKDLKNSGTKASMTISTGTFKVGEEKTLTVAAGQEGKALTIEGTLELAKGAKLVFAKGEGSSYLKTTGNAAKIVLDGGSLAIENLAWNYSDATSGAENQRCQIDSEGMVTITFTTSVNYGAITAATIFGTGTATIAKDSIFPLIPGAEIKVDGAKIVGTIMVSKSISQKETTNTVPEGTSPSKMALYNGASYTGTVVMSNYYWEAPQGIAYKHAEASLTNVKGGSNYDDACVIGAGSITISGNLVTGSGTAEDVATAISGIKGLEIGELEITGGKLVLSGEVQIVGQLTVGAKATLEIAKGATVTVVTKGTTSAGIVANGILAINGTVTSDATDDKKEVISGSGKVTIGADADVSDIKIAEGTETEVDPSAMSDMTVGGDTQSGATTYTQVQIVTVSEYWNLVKGAEITIQGKLVVPEGTILTIQAGAKLILQGGAVAEIEGTIVVEEKATVNGREVAAGILEIQEKSTLDVAGSASVAGILKAKNGSIVDIEQDAILTVTEDGTLEVENVSTAKITVKQSGTLVLNGDITKSAIIENYGFVMIDSDVAVTDDQTIKLMADGAAVDVVKFTVDAMQTVTDSGTRNARLTITDFKLQATSYKSGGVTQNVTIGDDNTSDSIVIQPSNGVNPEQSGKAYVSFTGIKATASVTSEATDLDSGDGVYNGKIYSKSMDVSGSFDVSIGNIGNNDAVKPESKVSADVAVSNGYTAPTFTQVGITVSDTVNLAEEVSMTVKDGKLSVSGMLVVGGDGKFVNDTADLIEVTGVGEISVPKTAISPETNVSAARYTTSAIVLGATVKTVHYVTLQAALAAADGTYVKEVVVLGTQTLTESAEVAEGVTLNGSSATINVGASAGADVTLTVSDGAVVKGTMTVNVNGTLFAENKTDVKISSSSIVSDVYSEEKDENGKVVKNGWAQWTNLAAAIASGVDTITISKAAASGDVVIASNLTIPAGVTVIVPADTAALKLNDGVVLTVDGVLQTSQDITAATRFAVNALNLTGSDGKEYKSSAVVVNGELKSASEFIAKDGADGTTSLAARAPIYGAFYKTDDWYVITTIDNALSVTDRASDITVNGKVVGADGVLTANDDSKMITVGTEPYKPIGANVTDSDIVATSLTMDSLTIGKGTSVVMTGAFTGTVVVGDNSVAFTAITGPTVVNSNDALALTGTASVGKGQSMAVSAGTVSLGTSGTGALPFTVSSGTLKVASGATAKVVYSSVSIDKLNVAGVVEVPSSVVLTVKTQLDVTGTVSIATATESAAAGSLVIGGKAYVGISSGDFHKSTSATAVLSGPFTLNAGASIYVASDATIDRDMSSYKSTAFYNNGSLWFTAYANGSDVKMTANKAPVTNAVLVGWAKTEGATEADFGTGADAITIGKASKLYSVVKTDIYTITILADEGVDNIYLNGNIMMHMSYPVIAYTDEVAAGTYTVTYTLKNGYSGEAKLALVDSDKTTASVSGMGLTVSGEQGEVKLQLTGIEKSGYTPAEPEKKIEGLTVTEILLIVLVVLVVIMAVIVALRLMRS